MVSIGLQITLARSATQREAAWSDLLPSHLPLSTREWFLSHAVKAPFRRGEAATETAMVRPAIGGQIHATELFFLDSPPPQEMVQSVVEGALLCDQSSKRGVLAIDVVTLDPPAPFLYPSGSLARDEDLTQVALYDRASSTFSQVMSLYHVRFPVTKPVSPRIAGGRRISNISRRRS